MTPVERLGMHLVSTGLPFGEDQRLSWPANLIGALLNRLMSSPAWPPG